MPGKKNTPTLTAQDVQVGEQTEIRGTGFTPDALVGLFVRGDGSWYIGAKTTAGGELVATYTPEDALIYSVEAYENNRKMACSTTFTVRNVPVGVAEPDEEEAAE